MSVILSNQVKCLKCGDTPYSAHRHDFVSCKCGAISVDGGMDYLKRSGLLTDYEDLSIVISDELFEECIKTLQWCKETKRNELGIVCALFRAIRDTGHQISTTSGELNEEIE